jgi:polyhydroxyalkanoate synthesis regulator phasin
MPQSRSSSSGTSARKTTKRTTTQAKSAATRTPASAKAGASKTARSARAGGAKAGAKTAAKSTGSTAKAARTGAKATKPAARVGAKRTVSGAKAGGTRTAKAPTRGGVADSLASFGEQLVNRVIKPLDLVLLTRERIQETVDDAAARGRVTRDDANELVAELVRRGRQQTDDILSDFEQALGRGREQIETATKRARRAEPVDRIVRTADKARRSVGVGPSFPILGYDDLTAGQVDERIKEGLTPAQLRKVRDHERRHANRKSVLAAIETALG